MKSDEEIWAEEFEKIHPEYNYERHPDGTLISPKTIHRIEVYIYSKRGKIICRPTAKAAKRFKLKWLNYYGYHCAYCTVDCSDKPTIDHIVPLCRGGGNTLNNLVIACYSCNQEKGNKLVTEFRPLILSPIKLEINYVN